MPPRNRSTPEQFRPSPLRDGPFGRAPHSQPAKRRQADSAPRSTKATAASAELIQAAAKARTAAEELGAPPLAAAKQSRPAPAKRTPARSLRAPDGLKALPDDAPGWMQRARRMALALESAIRRESISPALEGNIERAWAAWQLEGVGDADIARVAHLVQRAHAALRDAKRDQRQQAAFNCAEVLWNGLPPRVQRRVEFDDAVALVRELSREVDGWTAIVRGTSVFCGWTEAGDLHASQAIRTALNARAVRKD